VRFNYRLQLITGVKPFLFLYAQSFFVVFFRRIRYIEGTNKKLSNKKQDKKNIKKHNNIKIKSR